DGRHKQRSNHRTCIGSSVEDGRRQGALTFREPFSYGFDGSRKVSRLANRKRAAHNDVHSQQTAHESVRDSANRPDDERKRQAEFGSDFVNEPSGEDRHPRVNAGEKRSEVGKLLIAPAKTTQCRGSAKKFLQITNDLTVHVIDCRGEK